MSVAIFVPFILMLTQPRPAPQSSSSGGRVRYSAEEFVVVESVWLAKVRSAESSSGRECGMEMRA